MKKSMAEALKQIRGKNVDVAIIIGGGDELESEEEAKELGLAPDAERLEGEEEASEIGEEPGSVLDLQSLLEDGDPGVAASIGSLSKRAMKKGK